MESVIEPLCDTLSLLSQVRMRAVSRIFRDTIIVKKYSWYQHYKKIKENIVRENLITIIFQMDRVFIEDEEHEAVYHPIENHLYGSTLKNFIKSSNWYCCVEDFSEVLDQHGKEEDFSLIEEICDHCEIYTGYRPLQSALIQFCIEEFVK